VSRLFETSFSKKRKKWSKILTFFKRNTDMLINLIPDDGAQKSIFSTSKRVLTRPKSDVKLRSKIDVKFRPYSVNLVSYLILIFKRCLRRCYTHSKPAF
jgi:hypothetical protein